MNCNDRSRRKAASWWVPAVMGILGGLPGSMITARGSESKIKPSNDQGFTKTLARAEDPGERLKLPAFPGAEGFGAFTRGGRGGCVIEVTNLNDSGPGSFRAACEAKGPRIVVFRVAGTISLTKKRTLTITEPYITIAGQTAPGGGIALRNYGISVRTHDVVIRHLRIRTGGKHPSASMDCIAMIGHDIIIDHCSLSWSTDENMSTYYNGSRDITVQWCILSEGLHNSTHLDSRGATSYTPHSMGALFTMGEKGVPSSHNGLSMHHCLLAHNAERNPKFMNMTGDLVNNVIYNWRNAGTHIYSHTRANIVNNYYKKGANTERRYEIYLGGSTWGLKDPSKKIFIQGNIGPHCPTGSEDNWKMLGNHRGRGNPVMRVRERIQAPAVTTTSAAKALKMVLAGAGAVLPVRDAADARIVEGVHNGTGKVINDPSEVGGWPELASGAPPKDSDHDGMPDAWERKYRFDPADPRDGPRDADGDGYTNVEEFLNGTNPRPERKKPARVKSSPRRSAVVKGSPSRSS